MTFFPKSKIGRTLFNEGFDMSKKELGEVPFRISTITDPHIKQLIKDAAKTSGVPVADIVNEIKKEIATIEDLKKYSMILYETVAKDAVSQAAFKLIEKSNHKNKVKFSVPVFMELVKRIETEHEGFFPMRAPGETNYIFHIDTILVPSNKKELRRWNGTSTACASANGDFVFNVPFMQKLIDWASIENLHPQGLKYVSNGGDIPDEYAYIEFLIMHEMLHYTYGDFAEDKKFGSRYTHDDHNMAMDFRINYRLKKNGYEQLPIGLFSDHINYDRQGSYAKMVKLVHDELEKLPQPLRQKVEKITLDDHPPIGRGHKGKKKPLGVGDLVKNKDTGEIGQIERINTDGSFEVHTVKVIDNRKKKA